jgi:hypothetical protein
MAAGGLTTLPLPNDMFDEPSYGGYAGGGLVAFAAGELVETGDPAIDDPENTIVVPGPKDPPAYDPTYIQSTQAVLPSELGGLGSDIFANLSRYEEAAPRETRRATEFQEYLDRMLSPEEQRARRQEDMWAALGQIGARMATTPGSLLQAASTGVAEALPGIREAASARRAEERGARQALMGEERTQNQEVTARANVALDMLGSYNTLAEALQNRTFENLWRSLDRATQERIARINAAAGIRGSEIAASASRYGSDRQLEGERIADTRGTRAATTAAMNTVNDIVRGDITYVSATPERKQLIYDAAVARTFPLYGLPVPQSSGGGGAGGAVNYEDAMAAARGQ